jgi:hypothetical protein
MNYSKHGNVTDATAIVFVVDNRRSTCNVLVYLNVVEFPNLCKGASNLLVLVLVLARIVLVNLRPHYFSCSPGFGA